MGLIWLNDRLVDEAAAVIRVDDRGLLLGDGIFETIRAYGGTPFRLAGHTARLREGADRVALPFPRDLESAVLRTVEANHAAGDAAIRITLTRGPAPAGLLPPSPDRVRPTLIVSCLPYTPQARWYDEGVRTVLAPGRRNAFAATARVKGLGYLEGVVAQMHAHAAGADEALFLDTDGNLAEGTTSNVFLVVRGEVHTPPASSGILSGITRATVLEVAAERGLNVQEAVIRPELLEQASEVFLTASLREIVPVVMFEGRPVGSGRPGPVWRALLVGYREVVRAETGR